MANQAQLTSVLTALQQQVAAMTPEIAAVKAAGLQPREPPRDLKPPPGFPEAAPTISANQTGHALNSAGQACPTKTLPNGVVVFVSPQHCRHCDKTGLHLPDDCFSLEKNAEKKRKHAQEMAARNKRKQQRQAKAKS